jgi:hypothetical protein
MMIRFCDRRAKAVECNQISIRAAVLLLAAVAAVAVATATTELHNKLGPLLEFALRNSAMTSRGTEYRRDISKCPSLR